MVVRSIRLLAPGPTIGTAMRLSEMGDLGAATSKEVAGGEVGVTVMGVGSGVGVGVTVGTEIEFEEGVGVGMGLMSD